MCCLSKELLSVKSLWPRTSPETAFYVSKKIAKKARGVSWEYATATSLFDEGRK